MKLQITAILIKITALFIVTILVIVTIRVIVIIRVAKILQGNSNNVNNFYRITIIKMTIMIRELWTERMASGGTRIGMSLNKSKNSSCINKIN